MRQLFNPHAPEWILPHQAAQMALLRKEISALPEETQRQIQRGEHAINEAIHRHRQQPGSIKGDRFTVFAPNDLVDGRVLDHLARLCVVAGFYDVQIESPCYWSREHGTLVRAHRISLAELE